MQGDCDRDSDCKPGNKRLAWNNSVSNMKQSAFWISILIANPINSHISFVKISFKKKFQNCIISKLNYHKDWNVERTIAQD